VAKDNLVSPLRRHSTFSPATYRDLHNVSPSPAPPRRAHTFGTDMANGIQDTFYPKTVADILV
jgi:hypothetical protein